MASRKSVFLKLMELLDDLEEELFDKDSNEMYFNGKIYTKSEWRNCKAGIQKVMNFYGIGVKGSTNYLKKNPEYNRLMRKLSYYKNKKHKREKDFKQLEILQKEYEKWLKKKEEERIEKKKEQLDTLIERQKKKYENEYESFDEF